MFLCTDHQFHSLSCPQNYSKICLHAHDKQQSSWKHYYHLKVIISYLFHAILYSNKQPTTVYDTYALLFIKQFNVFFFSFISVYVYIS